MELLFGIYGRCFLAVGDILWAYFSRISDGTLGTFFGVVLELARRSEPWCFPAGSCFFRRCFPASSRRQQNLAKKAVFLGLQTRR